ncbi:hypothetical protein CLOM_g5308 [Closterium sp. NIES-68]|nr:hypothetical protein CLOM_g5308 [Closterium sp. NIES-68]GJP63945.1 hypothetical protein CLOP_g20973 [Closterium sp. NIES-67]
MSTIMDTPTRSPFLLTSTLKSAGKTGGPASLRRSGSGGKPGQRSVSVVKAGCSRLKAKAAATPVTSVKKAPPKVGITPRTPFATPKSTEGDRFIPSRSYMKMDVSGFAIRGGFDKTSTSKKLISPTGSYRKRLEGLMARCVEGGEGDSARKPRVLSFKVKAPAAESDNGVDSTTKIANSSDVPARRPPRAVSQVAEKVLDAPGVVDDYYLQMIDWSNSNLIAVALGTSVFIWNAENEESVELMSVLTEDEQSPYVTGVSWAPDGVHLAIAISNSEIQVWNVSIPQQVRTFKGHSAVIGAMDWYKTILSTGDHAGTIVNHDVRAREHIIARFKAHRDGVCGLKWAVTGRQLASGGDDNLVHIWDAASMSSSQASKANSHDGADRRRSSVGSAASSATGVPVPLLHRFAEHRGAVKALAWCPFQSHLLATGGGSTDCTIRFWNTRTGACVNSVDAESQVTGLHWSKKEREIVSAHGYEGANKNQLVVSKYPSLVPLARLKGHSGRVLSTAQAPDGDTVASISADESLRIWRPFNSDRASRTAAAGSKSRRESQGGKMAGGASGDGFVKSHIR